MKIPQMTQGEALEWLQQFIVRINNQDNAGTASPFYFVLQEKQQYPTSSEYQYDDIKEEPEDHEDPESETTTVYLKNHWEAVAFAFTREGIQRHLDQNRHNYKETRIWVEHGYRNPEMSTMLEAISTLVERPWTHR